MAHPSFAKHATRKGLSYLPADHRDGISKYSATAKQGQQLAIYYPSGSPNDYPVNRKSGRWAYMIWTTDTAYGTSIPTYADGDAASITNDLGSTVPGGSVAWQCLMNGIAIVGIQVTAAVSTAGGNAATGNGYFHAPGGTQGYYESKDRPSAIKDVVLATQYLQERADLFELNRDAWGYLGVSGAADILSWCGLAPSRALELGTWGPYRMNTVPNVNVFIDRVTLWWDYQDISGASPYFPKGESGGAGTDDTAAGAGEATAAALARYRRAASAISNISNPGTHCIPPTYMWSDVEMGSARFGEPFPTNVESDAHPTFFLVALRNLMPEGLCYVATGTSGVLTAGTTSIAPYCDRIDASGIGPPEWPDASGVAGIALPANEGTDSTILKPRVQPIHWILEHINNPRWDLVVPPEGITRRSQVNQTGRYVVPPRSNRAGVRITCTSEEAKGVLLWGTSQVGARTPIPIGTTIKVPGQGPIWLRASGGLLSVAEYEITELRSMDE